MDAVIYVIFAILAVYGAYTAVRELVIFIAKLNGKDDGGNELCNGCCGCEGCRLSEEDEKAVPDDDEDTDIDTDNDDFFRT